MSAFNIPSDNDTLLNTSPIEILFLLNQPEMPATLAAAFSDQPATLNLLREYAFITIGINNHLNEISRHHSERKALFDTLMTSRLFQETMYPYLNNYRDLRDTKSLPSYNTPSPNPTTTRLSKVRSRSGPGTFCGPRTRTSGPGPEFFGPGPGHEYCSVLINNN